MAVIYTYDDEQRPTAALPAVEPLARKTAHAGLYRKLVERGLDEPSAAAISRAVVDPADARRRLENLVEVRVPGGRLLALDTTLWTSAVASYAVNNREASARRFPAGVEPGQDEAALFRPLRPPTDPPDESARLELRADFTKHLVWSLERSVKYLLDNNDLSESIAAQGVMVAVTAVVVRCAFGDGATPTTMLATVDGSSRVTGAQHVLGLTPADVVLTLPDNERAYRGAIAEILTALDRPDGDVSEQEIRSLRALQLPARLLIGYEPDEIAPVGFARAVESLVHLVHVEPPKAWDEAASLDSKADSVVAALHDAKVITAQRRAYLDGMLTPEEARQRNLPGEADERALTIVATLSSEQAASKKAVRGGVLELAHAQKAVRKEEKARIAVELALRPVRSEYPPANIKSARGALQSAFLVPALWGRNVTPPRDVTIEQLRDQALAEIDDGDPGIASAVLAGEGAYWLAVHRVLREAHFFPDKSQRDGRSPQRVLEALMATRHGILVLYRAVLDGRDGQPPVRVDADGKREKAVTGQLLPMTQEWLRGTVVPLDGRDASDSPSAPVDLPTRILMKKVSALRSAVGLVEDAHDQLRGVQDATGTPLVDREGIARHTVEELRTRLEAIRDQLFRYGMKWEESNTTGDEDIDVDELDDDPEVEA